RIVPQVLRQRRAVWQAETNEIIGLQGVARGRKLRVQSREIAFPADAGRFAARGGGNLEYDGWVRACGEVAKVDGAFRVTDDEVAAGSRELKTRRLAGIGQCNRVTGLQCYRTARLDFDRSLISLSVGNS